MSKKQMNILWIQTDEQRTDSLRCYGNKTVYTPNLDALAESGMLFMNHHVQSPVCVPSRVCELTSRYPHQTGILDNTGHYNLGKWPEGMMTFPEIFAQAGYVTANFGKYHTPHHSTWLENWHFEMFPDETSHTNLAERFDEKAHEVIHRGNDQEDVIMSGRYPDCHNGRTPQGHITDTVIDWLRQYKHVRRPYLARVSFLAPHTPVLTPEPYYNMYDSEDMTWDAPDEEIIASRPAYELDDALLHKFKAHEPWEFARMRCSYYGLVADIDTQVGRLVQELKALGEYENTLIVFSSDHGTLMGEYGQFQKDMFYDLTTKVPMIITGPGVQSSNQVTRMTEAIDLGPTLLALADLDVPETMMGMNLLEDKSRKAVIGEIRKVRKGQNIRRSWIRTDDYSMDYTSEIDGIKTVNDSDRDGKLIDLKQDPLGHKNLYNLPEYSTRIMTLRKQFEERVVTDA